MAIQTITDNYGRRYNFDTSTAEGMREFDEKMQELKSYGGAGVSSSTGDKEVQDYFKNVGNLGRTGSPKNWGW